MLEQADSIAIGIFDVLGNEWLNAPGPDGGNLDNVKKKHIFLNKITYSSYCG